MLLSVLSLLACSENELSTYNTPPEVDITAPEEGTEVPEDGEVTFQGIVWDEQQSPDSLEVVWTSSVDGELGTSVADGDGLVVFPWTGLTEGMTHAITLTAFDNERKSSWDTVTVQTTGTFGAPTVTLIGPVEGWEYGQAEGVPVVASATDDEQDCATLDVEVLLSSVGSVWTGNPEVNCSITMDLFDLQPGAHDLTMTATDEEDNTGSASVSFIVLEDANPVVSVLSPTDGSSWWTSDTIVLEGEAVDDTTPAEDLTVTWTSDQDGPLLHGPPDSTGRSVGSVSNLSEGVHVITMTAVDLDAHPGSESVVVEVIDPLNHDGDGDGWTENMGDCDDGDATVFPDNPEVCDDIDNDCDGEVNEDWFDSYEPNDTSTACYDLGEVDDPILWLGDSLTLSGLTIHEPLDEDWFLFDVDDDIYDNANFSVLVQGLPNTGIWVLELWDMNGTPAVKASQTGNSSMTVSFTGDIFDDDEDDWAVRIYAATWPTDGSACSTTYQMLIST